MPEIEITLIISQVALDALNATHDDMLNYTPRPLPATVRELLERKPESVICLTKFGNGKYRLGGDFLIDYRNRQSGTNHTVYAGNVDPATGANITGENSWN